MLITVLHESVYADVCIMNEVELLIQICGLHKESKGRGKEPCGVSLYGLLGEAHGCCAYTFPWFCSDGWNHHLGKSAFV